MKHKDGNVIESTTADIEQLNGDGKTWMLHEDTCLSKVSSLKYLESFLLECSHKCKNK